MTTYELALVLIAFGVMAATLSLIGLIYAMRDVYRRWRNAGL